VVKLQTLLKRYKSEFSFILYPPTTLNPHSLLLWHQPEATQRLFTMLCLGFVMSLFLSTSYLLTFIGLGAGVKLFITDTIYRRYPKVGHESTPSA